MIKLITLCIISILIGSLICSCDEFYSHRVNILKYSKESLPNGFALHSILVNDAKKGVGRIINGSNMISDSWNVAFISDAEFEEVLRDIDVQLKEAGCEVIVDIDTRTCPQDETIAPGCFEILKTYSINTDLRITVLYWDYRNMNNPMRQQFTGSDFRGYSVEIYGTSST